MTHQDAPNGAIILTVVVSARVSDQRKCWVRFGCNLTAVILVGAIFVGSIETVWAGEITPPRSKSIKVTNYATDNNAIQLENGEELGRFNMGGSTIIVLFGPGQVKRQSELGTESRVQFGQALGCVEQPPI